MGRTGHHKTVAAPIYFGLLQKYMDTIIPMPINK